MVDGSVELPQWTPAIGCAGSSFGTFGNGDRVGGIGHHKIVRIVDRRKYQNNDTTIRVDDKSRTLAPIVTIAN